MFEREDVKIKIHNVYKYNALLLNNRYQGFILLKLPTIIVELR